MVHNEVSVFVCDGGGSGGGSYVLLYRHLKVEKFSFLRNVNLI